MKTWKIEKAYINNSIIVCSCGNRKSINNKKLKSYVCECVKNLSFDGDIKKLYKEYRNSALARGIKFNISEAQFEYLTGLNCIYCGNPPSKRHFNAEFTGIDREVSTEGYTKDNVLPCCSICNKMKSTMDSTEFFDHAIKIAERRRYIEREVFSKEPENMKELKDHNELKFKLGFYSSPISILQAAAEEIFDLNLIKYNLGESLLDFPEDLHEVATHPNSFCRHKAFGKNLRIATKEIVTRTNTILNKAKKDIKFLQKLLRIEVIKRDLRDKKLIK